MAHRIISRLLAAAWCSSALMLGTPAAAQARAGLAVPTPPSSAEYAPGEHERSDPEGSSFYLRVAAGGGLVGFDMYPEAGYEDHSADGASVALDLLLGVSPRPGAALGGALLLDLAPSMTLAARSPDDNSRSTMGIGIVGPFVDATPEPAWGLHIGLAAGMAALSIHPEGKARAPIYGLGAAAWAGNDFWVGPTWSFGAALRVSHTLTGDHPGEFDLEASCLATTLMLTAARR
jgi:hypothetical protein